MKFVAPLSEETKAWLKVIENSPLECQRQSQLALSEVEKQLSKRISLGTLKRILKKADSLNIEFDEPFNPETFQKTKTDLR